MDLAVASPATVSRCGMVYMEPTGIGWLPLLQSWFGTIGRIFIPKTEDADPTVSVEPPEDVMVMITSLYHTFFKSLLRFTRVCIREQVPTSDMVMAYTQMRLYRILLQHEFAERLPADMSKTELQKKLESTFFFSCVWSIGASTDTAGRVKLSQHVRELQAGTVEDPLLKAEDMDKYGRVQMPFPDKLTVYEYVWDGKWTGWMDAFPRDPNIPAGTAFHDITIQCTDSVQIAYFLQKLLGAGAPTLITGPTGTGKTIYIKDVLYGSLDKEKWTSIPVMFSAQTSANQTQDIIDSKLDKRRQRVFGPPLGKRCCLFVDDLNMPQVEEYAPSPSAAFCFLQWPNAALAASPKRQGTDSGVCLQVRRPAAY
jgi:dynein heavy chain